ncbi:uncharacterized protein LOC108980799 [Juglans regia]|uniref:Uncharacterized protein LOC108980799 n=1 Tax=Juglans regia TaxID=51240 RepID=A0A2I4DJM7_JUGRE|nr:uncharacterized protein LOC108980799 [Juglans regia]
MASEPHNEKTMRNPEDDESPAVKQEEDFSYNLERSGTKPKKDMLLKEDKDINGGTQDCDSSKRIATEDQAKTSDYTAPKIKTPLSIYRPGENSTSTFPNNNPSKMAPDQEKDLSSKEKKRGGRSTDPYSEPSKNVVDSVARTSSPLIEKEKKEVDSKNTAMISSSEPQYSQGDNRVLRKTPSKEKENKVLYVEADPYAAEKNIGVPYSSNADRGNDTSRATDGSYAKKKENKGSFCPCCSIL